MEDKKTRLKHRRPRSTVPRSLGLSCKCVLRKGILFVSHLPAQGTRLCREQRAAGTLVSSRSIISPQETQLPRGFRQVFKEALRPKNKPLEKQLPSWTRETRHAAGHAARGRLQSTGAKVPPAPCPHSSLASGSESGVCQPPRRPNCSPRRWKSQGGHSLQSWCLLKPEHASRRS